MFGRDRERKGEGKLNTYLGEGANFQGNLTLEGTVRIDGQFSGERLITKETVIIGERGIIKADIMASNVIIGGKVIGNIQAQGRVEILSGGEVMGNIKTSGLVIEEGVLFNGHCEMEKKKGKELVGWESAGEKEKVALEKQ